MSASQVIQTGNAPQAIGPYSQAVHSGSLVFLSGQVALDPETMRLVEGGIVEQTEQVFDNLAAVAAAAGLSLDNAVRMTIYLTDLGNFKTVNEIMARRLDAPYPARVTIGVAALPANAIVEIDAILSD
ncbi:MAG: RidA family protein [Gammaproteobacteria bacterium]|nr:Rid family detoxifying hydrolase [Gammaproteobacteria bacterium]MXX06337.1 RidA family protein [Gammaproteobacteria bacterium]MYA66180.1 RidA family protein [Gammaproteobacteria bacterium]MYE29039.1 RidA family protein [Gammaproteobacteria bacterium]MYH47270.1 RidA family protein [Gammaproteobacteria bacterium]